MRKEILQLSFQRSSHSGAGLLAVTFFIPACTISFEHSEQGGKFTYNEHPLSATPFLAANEIAFCSA
jgi:hypothetical protein